MGKKTLPNWEVFQVAWNEHANAPLSTMFRSFSHEKNRINAWKKKATTNICRPVILMGLLWTEKKVRPRRFGV
jgi:hypothetical protein